eukprot:750270-Hanusia_phi.AAC.1
MESLYTSRFLPPPSTATARNLLSSTSATRFLLTFFRSPTPREASADTEQDRLAVETCRDRGSGLSSRPLKRRGGSRVVARCGGERISVRGLKRRQDKDEEKEEDGCRRDAHRIDVAKAAGLSRRDSSPQKPPGEAEHADYPSASALAGFRPTYSFLPASLTSGRRGSSRQSSMRSMSDGRQGRRKRRRW